MIRHSQEPVALNEQSLSPQVGPQKQEALLSILGPWQGKRVAPRAVKGRAEGSHELQSLRGLQEGCCKLAGGKVVVGLVLSPPVSLHKWCAGSASQRQLKWGEV